MKSILSHIALLVPSVEKSAVFLSNHSFKCTEPEVFESEGTKEIYVGDYQDQSALLLLLEPIGAGPYQIAMKKRGPSVHHIAIDVLDLNEFVSAAKKSGWQLHPVSEHTMAKHKTAWMFFKGAPLLEIHEKKILSKKPSMISEVHMPLNLEGLFDFDDALQEVVSYVGNEVILNINGKSLSHSQIVCL